MPFVAERLATSAPAIIARARRTAKKRNTGELRAEMGGERA